MRADANQGEIVDGLRAAFCSVAITNQVGDGFSDLVVAHPSACRRCGGVSHVNTLVEVKVPGGRLSESQVKFHASWRGPIVVVQTMDEALRLAGRAWGGRAA
jgi:hypothetical protein